MNPLTLPQAEEIFPLATQAQHEAITNMFNRIYERGEQEKYGGQIAIWNALRKLTEHIDHNLEGD